MHFAIRWNRHRPGTPIHITTAAPDYTGRWNYGPYGCGLRGQTRYALIICTSARDTMTRLANIGEHGAADRTVCVRCRAAITAAARAEDTSAPDAEPYRVHGRSQGRRTTRWYPSVDRARQSAREWFGTYTITDIRTGAVIDRR